jgi:hypothetical protein
MPTEYLMICSFGRSEFLRQFFGLKSSADRILGDRDLVVEKGQRVRGVGFSFFKESSR